MGESRAKAWSWVPCLYFLEGLPNTVVMAVSVLFYTSLGMSATSAAALTSALYLPWAVKPFWSPLVDTVSTKRKWVLACALAFVPAFLALAFSPFVENWAMLSIAGFWFLGISSATFDIAADGFYMLALSQPNQAFFVGIRNSFYRLSMIFGGGGLLYIAGAAGGKLGDEKWGWSAAFFVCAIVSLICFFWFSKFLPRPEVFASDRKSASLKEFFACFKKFFLRRGIFLMMCYILFYRFAESQLCRIMPIFLKAENSEGGLGLSLETIGIIQGTNAPIALLCGGILGGFLISKFGLEKCIMPMAFAMNLPNLLYLFLALYLPQNLFLIGGCVFAEQFGYGLGFSSYMMYLIFASKGEFKTAFYAICTGFMALGLQLPGAASGYLKDCFGFAGFFWIAMLATLVSFAATLCALKTLKDGGYSQ